MGRTRVFWRLTIAFPFPGEQFLYIARVVEPCVHADVRLATLDAQRVPGTRFGQDFADRSLGKVEYSFACNTSK